MTFKKKEMTAILPQAFVGSPYEYHPDTTQQKTDFKGGPWPYEAVSFTASVELGVIDLSTTQKQHTHLTGQALKASGTKTRHMAGTQNMPWPTWPHW